MSKSMTMGLIIGNRGFFPDHLAQTGRAQMIKLLEGEGFNVVAVGTEETKFGAIETREEARRCAELFKSQREAIDGVIVSLPNFGDERGFEHHVAANFSSVAGILHEATTRYLGWDVYRHR